MADIPLNMPLRINTDEAIKDAKALSAKIQSTLSNVDMSKLDKGTANALKNISALTKELDSVVHSTEELGKAKFPTQEFAKLEAEAKVLDRYVQSTTAKLEGLRSRGLGHTDVFNQEERKLASFYERQYSVYDEMRKMRDSGTAYTQGRDTQAYKDSGASIHELTQTINLLGQAYAKEEEEAQRVSEGLEHMKDVREENTRTMGSYASAVGNRLMPVLRRLASVVQKVWHGLRSLASHMRGAHRQTNSFSNSLRVSLKNLLRYTIGVSSILALINRIRGTVKEAFKVMAQEIPEVNQAISQIGTSFKQLKAATGTMLQPLLQALAPIIDSLIQKVVSLMNAIGKFFATLTGQDYVYQATVANYDYAESVKEAEGALASFDKLNVIGKKDKNDLSLNKDTVKYTKVKIEPEDNWYTRLAKKIRDGWAKADLSGAGFDIATKLAELLDSISWDDIKARSTKFITTLTSGINGLTMPDDSGSSPLAISIGNFIGNAIDWAINNLHTLATTINWEQLGQFITDAIETLKKNLDSNETWRKAGEAFGELFQGLIDLGFEIFVKNNPFEGLGSSISDALDAFFKKGFEVKEGETESYFQKLGHILVKGLYDVLTEIDVLIDRETPNLIKAVQEIVSGASNNGLGKTLLLLGKVIVKGILLGIKLIVAAGLSAIGLSPDEGFVTFLAEALGLGLLATKLGDVTGKITGSGGLLSAFKKKDKSLEGQTKKVGLEKVAVSLLAGVLGALGIQALATSDEIGVLTNEGVGSAVTAFENLGDKVRDANKALGEETEGATERAKLAFDNLSLKLPSVDVSSLNVFEQYAYSVLQRVRDEYAKGIPEPKVRKNSTIPSTPLYDLEQQGIKATQGAQAANSTSGSPEYNPSTPQVKAPSTYSDYLANKDTIQQGLIPEEERRIRANASAFADFLESCKSTDLQKVAAKLFSEVGKKKGYSTFDQIFADQSVFDEALKLAQASSKAYGTSKTVGEGAFGGGLLGALGRAADTATFGLLSNIVYGKDNVEKIVTQVSQGAWEELLKMLPGLAAGLAFSYFTGGLGIPLLAQGAVLPPNQPFLAMVGDQKTGTNVETPLSTIEEAVANVMSTMGIKVTFDVKGDPNGLFKAVQKKAEIYTLQHHGKSAF